MNKKKAIVIGFVVLLFGVGAFVYWGQYVRKSTAQYYSGTIESTEAKLAFQLGGRVDRVLVEEGQSVTKGQVLAVLAVDELKARLAQAQGNLAAAKQTVAHHETLLALNRVSRPLEVDRAEAAVQAVEAEFKQQKTGYRPQEIQNARLAMEAAKAAYEEAKKNKDRVDALNKEKVATDRDRDAADLRFDTAEREYGRSQESYSLMKEGYRSETIEAARAKRDEAKAALALARANLKQIDMIEEDLAMAKAQVKTAEAVAEQADIQLGYAELKAPSDAIVVARSIEPGEVVTSGQEVLSLTDLSAVDLKIFVEETQIGKVKPGGEADVRIDTFPDRIFKGHVAFVSPDAEFTPKIIQTHKERIKLVFLVKIHIQNPDFALKTGMPADAWLK